MLKLLFILWVVWLLARSLRRVNRRPPPLAARPAARSPVEDMVACAWCGVHFPASERVAAGDLDFCCEAHRELRRNGPPPA